MQRLREGLFLALFMGIQSLLLMQNQSNVTVHAASWSPRASIWLCSGGRGRQCGNSAWIAPGPPLLLRTRLMNKNCLKFAMNLIPMRTPPPQLRISLQGRESAEEEICFSLQIEWAHVVTVVVYVVTAAVGTLDSTSEKVQGRMRWQCWVRPCICRKGIMAPAWQLGEMVRDPDNLRRFAESALVQSWDMCLPFHGLHASRADDSSNGFVFRSVNCSRDCSSGTNYSSCASRILRQEIKFSVEFPPFHERSLKS